METKYLGRVVSAEGIKPDPEAVTKIQEWTSPRNKVELQSFLGFANFDSVKQALADATVLAAPKEEGRFVLETDASVVAIAGILHQEQEHKGRTALRPIVYGSKSLTWTQLNCSAPKLEVYYHYSA